MHNASLKSTGVANNAELRLAAYTAKKLALKRARVEALNKLYPNLYSAPTPLHENNRMAPTVKRLLAKGPPFLNDENSIGVDSLNGSSSVVKIRHKSHNFPGKKHNVKTEKSCSISKASVDKRALRPKNDLNRRPEVEHTSDPEAEQNSQGQEQVQVVLDFLLEEKQVTPAVYRRMSSERLTFAGVQRRLSTMSTTSDALVPDTKVLEAVQKYIAQVQSSWDNDMASYLADNSSSNRPLLAQSVQDSLIMQTSSDVQEDMMFYEVSDNDSLLNGIATPSDLSTIQAFCAKETRLQPILESASCEQSFSHLKCLNDSAINNDEFYEFRLKHIEESCWYDSGQDDLVSINVDTYDLSASSYFDSDFQTLDSSDIRSDMLGECVDRCLSGQEVTVKVDAYAVRSADFGSISCDSRSQDMGLICAAFAVFLHCNYNRAENLSIEAAQAKGFKMFLYKCKASFNTLYDQFSVVLANEGIKPFASISSEQTYLHALQVNQKCRNALIKYALDIRDTKESMDSISVCDGDVAFSLPPLPSFIFEDTDPHSLALSTTRDMLNLWLRAMLPISCCPWQGIPKDVRAKAEQFEKGIRVCIALRQALRAFFLSDQN